MRLNPHLHVVALVGVYVAGPDGLPVFRALGRLKTDEVADVVQITKARVLKAIERRGVVRVSPEALEVDDYFAPSDPVLAQLAVAAVAGLPAPAGLGPAGATYAIDMDTLALLARLASAVPPPKQHLTRYSGVLAAAAHWRPLIIPPAPSTSAAPAPPPTSTPTQPAFTKPSKPPPSGTRCRYIRWAEILSLTFGVTLDQCPACRGRMKPRALVRDPESIERFLRHQGLWSPPENIAPARAPPYHRKVTRLSPTRQQQLFPEA